jgi:hypothetical protein
MQDLLVKIINNLVTAAFIPAIAFTALCAFAFDPVLLPGVNRHLNGLLGQPSLAVLLVAMVLGFTLLNLKSLILKYYRGYYLLEKFPSITCRLEQRSAERFRADIAKVEKEIINKEGQIAGVEADIDFVDLTRPRTDALIVLKDNLLELARLKSARTLSQDDVATLESEINSLNPVERDRGALARLQENVYELAKLKDKKYELGLRYRDTFPEKQESILATRFGNLWLAAESYPSDRYGIDATIVWPRLTQCIPAGQYDQIDQVNNQVAFLVNSSLLAMVFTVLCLLVTAYQLILFLFARTHGVFPFYFISVDLDSGIYLQRAIVYLVVGGAMLFVAWAFYKASLPICAHYGTMYRSAFDLYRFNLLKQLKEPFPQNSNEEFDCWTKVTERIAHGFSRGPMLFEYEFADEDARSVVAKPAHGYNKQNKSTKYRRSN